MTDRLDALMTRSYTDSSTGEQKTAYTKIGVAFPLDGGGYRLKLDAVPVPTIYDNRVECSFLLVPPRERDQQPASQPMPKDKGSRQIQPPAFEGGASGDDIPFAPEWRV